jgi:hypothetical protein
MAYEKPPASGMTGAAGSAGPDVTPVQPTESERRSAVGCAWWWWVLILLLLVVLIWMWFGWWRATPPVTGPTPDQPPVTAPGEPTLPPPGQPPAPP